MSYQEDTIDWQIAQDLSDWLDKNVSQEYKDQPLAQDWARIAKVQEELGEAIAEFISWSGQNPRKPRKLSARDDMCKELADTVLTGIYALCHFEGAGYARLKIMSRMKEHADRIGLYK
jgi:hypothetical protein